MERMGQAAQILDRMLDPIGRALTPEVARELVALRADAETQAYMDRLADRANEGLLTEEEAEEYDSLISAANLIAILQAKARLVLRDSAA